jgi:hypothetical protein
VQKLNLKMGGSMREERLRYRKKVKENEITGCWEWFGGRNGNDYGQFYKTDIKKLIPAHRFLFMILHNLKCIPHGMVLHHICGNRCCVNPYHLQMVTQTENIKQAAEVGAYAGARNGKAKLTEKQVREIRVLFDPRGEFDARSLSAIYGVCVGTIYAVLKRRRYKNVTD